MSTDTRHTPLPSQAEVDPDWKGTTWYPKAGEIKAALPGFFFVVLPITVCAEALWLLELSAKKQYFIDIFIAAVLAIVVGNVISLSDRLQPGLHFSTKWFLRLGIIIYGLKFSYKSLETGGLSYLAVIVVSVVTATTVALGLAAILKLNRRTGALLGTGTAICGVAAAMATAPSIKARAEEIGVALGAILFWGTLGLFFYPIIGSALHLSHSVYGAWTGAALHDLPQIVAAAQQGGGATGLKYALLVKLVRIAFIVVMVLFMSIYFTVKEGNKTERVGAGALMSKALGQFPLFVGGFFIVVLVNTFVKIPASIAGPLATAKPSVLPTTVAGVLLTFAIVGICARVTRPVIAAAGPRAMVVGFVTWAAQSVLVLAVCQALIPHLS